MRVAHLGLTLLAWPLHAVATILQNGQVREDPYPGQAPRIALDDSWSNYGPDVPEISYKGRWDSKHVSCTTKSNPFTTTISHSNRCAGWSLVA